MESESFPFDEQAPLSLGWLIWLAWVFGMLGVILATATWIAMGLALLTPVTVDQSLLTAILLSPVIGGAISLPGMVFALLATRRARIIEASPLAPVILVCVTTAVLVGALLFGGLVSYPRAALGTFGEAIQAHCARFAQSVQPYGNPPELSKLEQDPLGLIAVLQGDQAALPDDQAALNALTAPDPMYQPLLDDCRHLTTLDSQVVSSLLSELIALPPNLAAAQKTMTQYQADTANLLAEIQQLGAALRRQVFAPFHPG